MIYPNRAIVAIAMLSLLSVLLFSIFIGKNQQEIKAQTNNFSIANTHINNPNNSSNNINLKNISNSNETKFLTYSNSSYRFTIKFPADWIYTDNLNNNVTTTYDPITVVDFLLPGSLISSNITDISITHQNLFYKNLPSKVFTLMDVENQILVHPRLNITSEQDFKLGYSNSNIYDAYAVSYNYVDNSSLMPVKRMEVGMTDKSNNIGYIFIYEASPDLYDKYLPTIERMLQSFQISSMNNNNKNESKLQ